MKGSKLLSIMAALAGLGAAANAHAIAWYFQSPGSQLARDIDNVCVYRSERLVCGLQLHWITREQMNDPAVLSNAPKLIEGWTRTGSRGRRVAKKIQLRGFESNACQHSNSAGVNQASFAGRFLWQAPRILDRPRSSRSLRRVPPRRAADTGAGPGPTELTKGASGLRAETNIQDRQE